jgi:hypothetical protein
MKHHIYNILTAIRDHLPFLDDWGMDWLRYDVFYPYNDGI